MTAKVALPNLVTPNTPVILTRKCVGCNHCWRLPDRRFLLIREKPYVLHPDECWYRGTQCQQLPTQEP